MGFLAPIAALAVAASSNTQNGAVEAFSGALVATSGRA
jgi:hypothetical protein